MAWQRLNHGLQWQTLPHPHAAEILTLLDDLEQRAGTRAKKLCSLMRDSLRTGLFDDQLIRRLSKWCDWSCREQESLARNIGRLLFGRYPQPRFIDDQNHPIPNMDALYRQWWQGVVELREEVDPLKELKDSLAKCRAELVECQADLAASKAELEQCKAAHRKALNDFTEALKAPLQELQTKLA